jgi:hypothetical protein
MQDQQGELFRRNLVQAVQLVRVQEKYTEKSTAGSPKVSSKHSSEEVSQETCPYTHTVCTVCGGCVLDTASTCHSACEVQRDGNHSTPFRSCGYKDRNHCAGVE